MNSGFQTFHHNMDIVFLVYGAAFYFLGITILTQPRRGSSFQLASILWLLASFSLLHGTNEWLDMWKLAHEGGFILKIFGFSCLVTSYVFLFEFGRQLMLMTGSRSPKWQQIICKYIGFKIYILPTGGILLAALFNENLWLTLNILSRYLFGFTGALFTGVGFFLYYLNEEQRLSSLNLKISFILATSVFIVYGIVGGLIVPAADFFPADILNYDNFLAATQIPVQVIRAASAIIVAFSVTHILKMFRWEADSKLEDSLKQAHDALASVEQLSRRNKILLQYSGHGILGVNKKGIFTFANPVALKILASKESEIIGRSVEIIRCKEKDHEYLLGNSQIIEAVYKGVMKQVYDAELQRTDGSMITIDYQVMPVSETGEEDVSVITFQDVSERKIIEQKLVKLSRVVEQSPVSIVITDKNGTIEYINPKFSKLTGYELADAVGENPRILNSGNQSREFYQDMWQTISSGSQWEGELLNKKKGGELFWEKALISPIVDKQNKVTNYVAVKEDITHRKKMEEEIYSTMQHLRLYREQAPLGGIEWDTNFCVVEWNAAAEKIFGYTYNEAKGNNPLKFLMPEYVVTDIEQIWDALITQTGGEKSINENITKDGRVILCEWHNAPLRDESGKVVGVASVVQDITERFQAEQSLKRVNRSLQALSACNEALVRAVDEKELLHKVCKIIVDISGYRIAWVGFVEHDNEKSIRPMAQAGCQEGYLDNLILSWDDVLTEQQSPAGKAIRTGEPCIMRNVQSASTSSPTGDITIKSDNYSTISLPIKNKDQIFGALSICAVEQDAFDSDEIKLLQELSDDLAFGITTLRSHQERHHLNRQLQQAQKMEAVGQLTGGIAHDFNNILSSILGFTNLALQRFVGDDQPKLQKYLTEVVRAGERARDLVAQMLAFSRTDTRKASHMQLLPMIKEVTKMLQVTLPSSIELSNNFEGGVPDVLMNQVHMQQVLMNLCINARDAIEGSGSINISVRPVFAGNFDKNNSTYNVVQYPVCDSCHNIIDEGEYVELSVEDTGSGINANQLKQIFEPFFTTKDVGKGSGMGLSMVHGIVHQYGGHIVVDSGEDGGTKFRLLFPVEYGDTVEESENENKFAKDADGLNNAHILVVDDEKSVAMFIGDLLESQGGKVTIKLKSQAALDLFSKDPMAFDLVITDQTMPGLTGVELAKRILQLRPDLPIIMCTGYSEYVNEDVAKQVGIRGYLAKPMDSSELINLVQSFLV